MSNLKTIFSQITVTMLVQSLVLFLTPVGTSATGLSGSHIGSATSLTTSTLPATTSINSLTNISETFLDPASDSPAIAIRAINPGYTTDAGKNSGELIELVNLSGGELALDYLAVVYTAKPSSADSPGKSTILYRFPAGAKFVGENILLRYESAPEATPGAQDLLYSTSLAMNGTLSLVQTTADLDLDSIAKDGELSAYGETIQSVCWLGGSDCLPTFSTTVKSRSYTTIVRNPDTGEYVHVATYTPKYSSASSGLFLPVAEETDREEPTSSPSANSPKGSECAGLIFSEILSYYDTDFAEQFIELYNPTSETLTITNCQIKYKNKLYHLSTGSATLAASEYFVLRPEFRLTKNPNSENTLELIDADGSTAAKMSYPHGQKKSAAYALIGYNPDGTENWQITYAPTPGAANIYQEYQSCPAGKVINTATGNCVKAATVTSTLKDCPEGKYRNPATGRCKSISSSSSEPTPCKEGYERNPETNRCRKVKENPGADYPVVPVTGVEEQATFIALWAIGGVAIIGAGYVIFQFRKEIIYFFRKLFTKH